MNQMPFCCCGQSVQGYCYCVTGKKVLGKKFPEKSPNISHSESPVAKKSFY